METSNRTLGFVVALFDPFSPSGPIEPVTGLVAGTADGFRSCEQVVRRFHELTRGDTARTVGVFKLQALHVQTK